MTSVAPRTAGDIVNNEDFEVLKISEAVSTALSRLTAQHPFYACFIYDQMEIVETMLVPTAATDGMTIFVNPQFFASLNLDQQVFLFAHEVLHGIFRHLIRAGLYETRGFGPDMKPYNRTKGNHAMDYVINAILTESGTGEMPIGGLIHPKFTSADLWDEVYPELPDPPEEPEGQGQGQGSGDGSGGFDEHLAPGQGKPVPSEAETKRAIQSAKNSAKALGKMPGVLDKIVTELVEPSQNWKEMLRTLITATKGNDSSTWARPNRRRLAMPPHIYFPGTTGFNMGGVIIAHDTSGSVGHDESTQFMGENANILSECKPEWMKVFWVDTQVQHVDDVDEADELLDLAKWSGGGTHMPAIFDYIEKEGLQPEVVVILTDGYTDFGSAQPYRVIWGITSPNITASHGETVYIDLKQH